jgi:hypothetical protein
MSTDLILSDALEIIKRVAPSVHVPVPEDVVVRQHKAVAAYQNILPLSFRLPDTPAHVQELPPVEFAVPGIPLADLEPGDIKSGNYRRKIRPIKMRGQMSYVACQNFIFERPVLVKDHAHFGFVRELRFAAHVYVDERKFDPALFDAVNIGMMDHNPCVTRGRRWITGINRDGLELFYLRSAPTKPTVGSIMYTLGNRLSDYPTVWRSVTRLFEKEPLSVDLEYQLPNAQGKTASRRVNVVATEAIDRDPGDIQRRAGARSTSAETFANPRGLCTGRWEGLTHERDLTSITLDEKKVVVGHDTVPVLSVGPVFGGANGAED